MRNPTWWPRNFSFFWILMKSLLIDLNLLITEALYWFQLAKKHFNWIPLGNALCLFTLSLFSKLLINIATEVFYPGTSTDFTKQCITRISKAYQHLPKNRHEATLINPSHLNLLHWFLKLRHENAVCKKLANPTMLLHTFICQRPSGKHTHIQNKNNTRTNG